MKVYIKSLKSKSKDRKKGLSPPPLSKNYARPVQNMQGGYLSILALQDLHRGAAAWNFAALAPHWRACHSSFARGASVRAAPVSNRHLHSCQLNHIIFVNTGLVCFRWHFVQTSAIHPLPHIRPPPASARPPVCLISPPLRSGDIVRPNRRVAALRPPGVGLPRAARPGAWRRWRRSLHPFVVPPLSCSFTATRLINPIR